MIYTPHYELYVWEPRINPNDILDWSRAILAQITPIQTLDGVADASVDLQSVYGSTAGRRCVLHTCTHAEGGSAGGPCTEALQWQS